MDSMRFFHTLPSYREMIALNPKVIGGSMASQMKTWDSPTEKEKEKRKKKKRKTRMIDESR